MNELQRSAETFPRTEKMPLLFVGHGNPINAIEDNVCTAAWRAAAESLPVPAAILSVSAHWFVPETSVHGAERPETIHDFYGFPRDMYRLRYDCPGSPDGARLAQATVHATGVGWDERWGIDHGTWVVLLRMYPEARVPVFQCSVHSAKPSSSHYGIGRELSALRERGILIITSGNIVHNLGIMDSDRDAKPFGWAEEFDDVVRKKIERGDDGAIVAFEKLGDSAALAVPTPDHYWPLLYALGARDKGETPSFFAEGIAHGSVGMRAVRFG